MARSRSSPVSDKIKITGLIVPALVAVGILVWFLTHVLLGSSAKRDSWSYIDLSENFTDRSADTNLFVNGIIRGPEDLVCLLKNGRILGNVRFFVTGIISLKNKEDSDSPYPESVDGIKIDKTFRAMHLLHGTTGWNNDGVPVAFVVFHYADGSERKALLSYGKHVRDWFQSQENAPPDPNTVIAWTMHSPISNDEKAKLRIYRTTIENPQPNLKVVSVDYASALTGCAPFLLGMTLEH